MKRSPMPKRRTTKRRTTSQRCSVRTCNKPAKIRGWCVSHAEQVADRLFSRWVRDRDETCQAVGVLSGECKGGLQAAHLVGRRNHSVRYEPANVFGLCMSHHMTIDQHGQEHAKYRLTCAVSDPDWLAEKASRLTKREASISEALSWLASPGGTKE